MKDIIIVCAGGFGIEIYDIIEDINKKAEEQGGGKVYNVLGFLSDVEVDLESEKVNSKIIGRIQDWYPKGGEVYALGISTPRDKETLAQLLKSRGAKFETIIAPSCKIGKNVSIGEGCILGTGTIGRGAQIGNFVNVMGSMVGNKAIIGDYSTTTGYSNITNAHIGRGVFVGSHAVIMNEVKIEDDAFICANSLVLRRVKAGAKVFGSPAKVVDW